MFDLTSPNGLPIEYFTHYLYIFIILIVFILSSKKNKNNLSFLFLPLFILWVFAFSRDAIGVDYENYFDIFNEAEFGKYTYSDTTIEPGFYYLNAFLNSICSYKLFGFIFFHGLILYLLYRVMVNYKHQLSYPFVLLAYTTMWYFLSFNLLRICIASIIVCYAIKFLLTHRYYKYIICVLLATAIHMSAFLMIFPGLAFIVYKRYPKFVILGFILIFIVISTSISTITRYIGVERYADYLLMDQDSGIGMNIFFTYIPLAYWLAIGRKYISREFWDLSLVFTIFAFIIDFSGYRMAILGRLRAYSVVPFLLYLPTFVNAIYKVKRRDYKIQVIVMFLYFFIKYYLFLPQLYWSDGLMPYKSLL